MGVLKGLILKQNSRFSVNWVQISKNGKFRFKKNSRCDYLEK